MRDATTLALHRHRHKLQVSLRHLLWLRTIRIFIRRSRFKFKGDGHWTWVCVFFFLSARGSILYIQVDAFRWQPVLQSHHEVKELRANIVQYNTTLAFTTLSSLGVKAEWSVLEQLTSRKEHVKHATSTLVCICTSDAPAACRGIDRLVVLRIVDPVWSVRPPSQCTIYFPRTSSGRLTKIKTPLAENQI